MKIIVIDNYDSFVYNICDYIGRQSSAQIIVYRNDEKNLDEILKESPDGIVVSPGPGKPEEAGISIDLIKNVPETIPLLGVCLGNQAIGVAFGAKVGRAENIFHGKTSMIQHDGKCLFENVANPFEATRYHSLIIMEDTLTEDLIITAWTENKEIMGVRHKKLPVFGVQFHPESILTDEGMKIIGNFLRMIKA